MFTTLVESRAVRRRSMRGVVASVAMHTFVIGALVAVTIPTRVDGSPEPPIRVAPPIYFLPAPPPVVLYPATPATSTEAPLTTPPISIPVPTIVPTSLPPIDIAGPVIPAERILVGGGPTLPSTPGAGATSAFTPGAILDAGAVDRVPHITGNASPPRYPDMLRQSGATGQVVVRFVVDTLGRAELGDLVVVDASHPLFASAVKTALMGYRFTPGEAAGRKVRTLVQIPFSFTLK